MPPPPEVKNSLSYSIYREPGGWKRNDPSKSLGWEVGCVHTLTVTFSTMANPREGVLHARWDSVPGWRAPSSYSPHLDHGAKERWLEWEQV